MTAENKSIALWVLDLEIGAVKRSLADRGPYIDDDGLKPGDIREMYLRQLQAARAAVEETKVKK
jgi:hypothetical protein